MSASHSELLGQSWTISGERYVELLRAEEQLEALREELAETESKVREAQDVAIREWNRNKEFRKQREDARYAAVLADDQEALASNPAKSPFPPPPDLTVGAVDYLTQREDGSWESRPDA